MINFLWNTFTSDPMSIRCRSMVLCILRISNIWVIRMMTILWELFCPLWKDPISQCAYSDVTGSAVFSCIPKWSFERAVYLSVWSDALQVTSSGMAIRSHFPSYISTFTRRWVRYRPVWLWRAETVMKQSSHTLHPIKQHSVFVLCIDVFIL